MPSTIAKFKVGDLVVVNLEGEYAAYYGKRLKAQVFRVRPDNTMSVELFNTGSQDTEGHNAMVNVRADQCEAQ